jgi:hypothetical protein
MHDKNLGSDSGELGITKWTHNRPFGEYPPRFLLIKELAFPLEKNL